jgi:hypothetical protein
MVQSLEGSADLNHLLYLRQSGEAFDGGNVPSGIRHEAWVVPVPACQRAI